MPLYVVATPIGNLGDITLRAIECLKNADIVIGEERRETSTLLKRLNIEGKSMEFLNEHSTDADLTALLSICREQNVALISDCGTPGFCDPGARLVAACRAKSVAVTALPGASSLMCLLAICGQNFRQFVFCGFLPAERNAREQAVKDLVREKRAIVLMDTPYRLSKLMKELTEKMPARQAVLGCDFTTPEEQIYSGTVSEIANKVSEKKAEFVLMLNGQGL